MKSLIAALALVASFAVNAAEPTTLLSNKTATTTINECIPISGGRMTFQGYGTTTAGSGAAVITVQGTDDQTRANWVTLGTITLTLGTTSTTDGFMSDQAWLLVCGYVTSISGTGASVSLVAAK